MSARAMGSATVSFGLVSIPVKLYSTNQATQRISFNMLHAKCGARLKQQYICPQDQEIVAQKDMAKGYEFAKGRYVQFTADEVKALGEKPTQSIDITEFVPMDKVDLLFFDKAYYLGPDKGGERAYALLGKAMRQAKRAALAKYAARGKQYLVLVRAVDVWLVMQQLHYATDIKPISEVPVGTVEVKPSELELALQVIEQIATDQFKPEAYHDEVQERLEAAVAQKVEGQEVTIAPTDAPKAQIVDLMAALKASLGAGESAGEAPARKPAKRVAKKAGTTRKAKQSS